MNTTKKGNISAIQHCSECGVRLSPTIKGDEKIPHTWEWRECGICEEIFCDKCADYVTVDDVIVCLTCLQNPNFKDS